MTERVGVMQVIDSLDAGGAERVAVNLANLLPRERYRPFLCTTRRDGALGGQVAAHVGRLDLGRTRRFDAPALRRLVNFVRAHEVRILHAHGTALLVAGMASLVPPYPAVVWHDHYGRFGIEDRPVWVYRLLVIPVDAVIAVSPPLAAWSRDHLRVRPNRVCYIPNFVCEAPPEGDPPDLPGEAGARIICVANFRPQKDHPTLLQAMELVIRRAPAAHLLLVGAAGDTAYLEAVKREIVQRDLTRNVSLLGQRMDIPAVLRACDVGVLSSASEGLPLALIEYGMSRLPAVATGVGQCPEVLLDGEAGVIVPPGAPEPLAEALLGLLASPSRRVDLAERLYRRAREVYGAKSALNRIHEVYEMVMNQ